jgi:uncharacterized protein
MKSALYAGHVVHSRLRPKRHKLSYRVFSLLLDLDELDGLSKSLKLFGYNRAALFSFHDRDHAGGRAPREWVLEQARAAGTELSQPRISVLCYPRILGYVFNPLTVWFCADGGELKAVLYEVHNTFGEWRTYVIPVGPGADKIEQSCAKELYVSPFIDMDCSYRFRIEPPGSKVMIGVDDIDAQGLLLRASFAGERRDLTDRALLRAFLAYPLMTLKVTAAIHWEALKLMAKGVPAFRHRKAASRVATTVIES